MNPSEDEARAALYNSACCLVKDKQWQAAADAVAEACNNYGLKYSVAVEVAVHFLESLSSICAANINCTLLYVRLTCAAVQDPDLKQLRDRREWLDATENMKGGISKAGLVELRSEAKAPFRLIRMFLTIGAGAAALLSLGITLFALKGAVQGILTAAVAQAYQAQSTCWHLQRLVTPYYTLTGF